MSTCMDWFAPVESELTEVCKGATEGVEEESVTEIGAVNIPGIVGCLHLAQ